MLDLCLALGVPSPRHLEHMLTQGEINAWFHKLARDQFNTHGHDVRDAVKQARLFSALFGMMGKKKTVKPKDMMIEFSKTRRVESGKAMERKMEAFTRAMGGTVNGDRKAKR